MEQVSKPLQQSEENSIHYQLMSEVGIDGNYQNIVIAILYLLAFQSGLLLFGTSYYFAVPPYTQCAPPYQGLEQCTSYTCSLPYQKRKEMENPQISRLETLGNQFQDYHCQKQSIIEQSKGVFSLGGIAGLIIFSILADNIGRRPTLILCQTFGLVGLVSILFVKSLMMAEICLFISGFGMVSNGALGFCICSEVLSNKKRQKIQILIQAFLCLGGALISVAFFFLNNWKLVFLIFLILPLVIALALTCFFLQETPLMLIKISSVYQIRQSFRFIANLNNRNQQFEQSFLLSENHISKLKLDQEKELNQSHKSVFTYIDLFRYPSLRKVTIVLIFFICCTSILYFSPLTLVDQFGFNFYLNGVILNSSELITYLFTFNAITKIQRKQLFSICLTIGAICSFALIFINKKEVCIENCWNWRMVLQLVIFIVFRFAIALESQVALVYATELYPVQVAGLGIGLVNILFMIPSTFIASFLNYLERLNFSVMIFFFFCACLGLCCLLCLNETLGNQASEKIEEIHRDHEHLAKKGTQQAEERP